MTTPKSIRAWAATVLVACLTSACAGGSLSGATAPEPTKRVDVARFYTGTWLEIGRRPMFLTDGCVAGTTSYTRTGGVHVKDACREKAPNGPEKSIEGEGTILDPGFNAKLRVRYNTLITRDYWILDHADDYSWFIEASPDFSDLYIFTRKVPSASQRAALIARAKGFGYDVSKLEFPPQPPR